MRELKYQVVEHTCYDEKVVHIKNISYTLANLIAEIMNRECDSYFIAEGEDDEESEE